MQLVKRLVAEAVLRLPAPAFFFDAPLQSWVGRLTAAPEANMLPAVRYSRVGHAIFGIPRRKRWFSSLWLGV
jgi:hypothetical protein